MTNSIVFEKLGISLELSPIAFSIGSKGIYWYALIILTGFIMGIISVSIGCEKRGLTKDNVIDIALYGIISGIVCATADVDKNVPVKRIENSLLFIIGSLIRITCIKSI